MKTAISLMFSKYVLLVFSLWCTTLWAQVEEDISSIETSANQRASAYTKEINQINKTLTSAKTSNEIRQIIQANEPITIHLKKVSQVLVFLSFSMPEKSLQAWLLQCKQSGATPVIRGLIHNSFKETMDTIQILSKKTGIGMQIDPILFKTFNITVVPAVVYVKDTPSCPTNMDCKPVNYDSLLGDVSLDYALEKIRNDEESEHLVLDQMLSRLKGNRA